jgi:hypothetical protein
MLISNSLISSLKNFLKRIYKQKTLKRPEKQKSTLLYSHSFSTFLEAFSKSISTNLKSAYNFAFFDTQIDLCFWVIVALFANFECKCAKTVHFQAFCKK